jgi:hypothetical protein
MLYSYYAVLVLQMKILRQSEINHSYSKKTGVENMDIGLWFTPPHLHPHPLQGEAGISAFNEGGGVSAFNEGGVSAFNVFPQEPSIASELAAVLHQQGDAPFLGIRSGQGGEEGEEGEEGKYTWRTYRQVAVASAELAAGLSARIPRRACVGIASHNRPEWLEADFACAFADYLSVGLHVEWTEEKLKEVMLGSGNIYPILMYHARDAPCTNALCTHAPYR